MEYVYLDLFSQSTRPTIHFIQNDALLKPRKLFCDQFLVVLRNWDSEGAGDFIPQPLAVDMVRAAAYKRAGVKPVMKTVSSKLNLVQVSRVTKRMILNERQLLAALQEKYNDTVWFERGSHPQMIIQFTVLERESAADQVKRFLVVDILVAAHGAGLTNTIFMLPNSYLIELMPPYWYLACYRRLAEDASIGYKMLRAKGKKGPQCDKDPSSLLCQQKGIRDRNFNTSIPDVVKTVAYARGYVLRRKYRV